MRVTIVLPGFTPEAIGGYKVLYSYANYLAAHDFRVTVVQSNLPCGGTFTRTGLRHFLVSVRQNWRRGRRPKWFILDPRISVRNHIRLSVADIPPADVLVATSVETAAVVSAASEFQGISGAYFIQHFEIWAASESQILESWSLPLSLIAIAPWIQRKIAGYGLHAALIPNAIDTDEFPLGPAIAGRSVHVAALVSQHAWKRTDLVIETFRRLDASIPNFSAVTFGECDRPSGLPESVVHYRSPPRATLRTIYQQSRIYLCASDAEGWHLPPAEAMSAGAAVVSTDIDGVRAYADGVAYFVPKDDSKALASACLELLGDNDRCQRLAADGHARIRARAPHVAGEEFLQFLKSINMRNKSSC